MSQAVSEVLSLEEEIALLRSMMPRHSVSVVDKRMLARTIRRLDTLLIQARHRADEIEGLQARRRHVRG